MKRISYAAALCLSACSTAPTASFEQEAISAYIKANTNAPASYEVVRWGRPAAFTREDSAKLAAETLNREYEASLLANMSSEQHAKMLNDAIRLESVTDTTRVGTTLIHAFRAKNKLGVLVLDSTQFVVYKSGKVTKL